MHHESTQHSQNAFLTLTYGNPCPEKINKRDVQLFIKRLRKLLPVRYFACGEYGTRSGRPHYHAIIFGQDFLAGSYPINDELYGNSLVDTAWGKGFASIGQVTIQSCMYVAGYVNKKAGQQDTFNLMSRRPGIGHTWIDRYKDDIKRTGIVAIEGKEFPVPKSYLDRHPDYFQQLKNERKAHFAELTPAERLEIAKQLPARELQYTAKKSLSREII